MPIVGFLPATDPRVSGTVEAIERELMPDGLVLRYDTAKVTRRPASRRRRLPRLQLLDGQLPQSHRPRDDARKLFDRLLSLAQRPRPALRGIRHRSQAPGRQLPPGLLPHRPRKRRLRSGAQRRPSSTRTPPWPRGARPPVLTQFLLWIAASPRYTHFEESSSECIAFASGRRTPARSASKSPDKCTRSSSTTAAGGKLTSNPRAPAWTMPIFSTTRTSPSPIRAPPGSPAASTAPPAFWITPPSRGPTPRSAAPPLSAAILYELHIGTFTPEGTFDAAPSPDSTISRELGVTHVELMPVAEFSGKPRLGLRRRGPLRAAPGLRRARRPEALRRRLPRPRPRPSCSTSSTTTSAPTAITSRKFGPYFTAATTRPGATPSTSTARAATRCAASSATTP